MTETYTGVVDRIVDGEIAVILLEQEDRIVDQVDVPVEQLPSSARTEGMVMAVTRRDDEVVDVTVRVDETERRQKAARERLDRLSRPLSDKDEER